MPASRAMSSSEVAVTPRAQNMRAAASSSFSRVACASSLVRLAIPVLARFHPGSTFLTQGCQEGSYKVGGLRGTAVLPLDIRNSITSLQTFAYVCILRSSRDVFPEPFRSLVMTRHFKPFLLSFAALLLAGCLGQAEEAAPS